MKTLEWLNRTKAQLAAAGITTARLDSLVLLEDATGRDRSWLLARPEHIIPADQLAALQQKVARRVRHVPLAYLRGKTEFYGREFLVNNHTLEPRPESETIITLLKQTVGPRAKPITIADIGTGTGALAITAQLELPKSTVYAIDIDSECVRMTEVNAKKHKTTINTLQGDLLEPLVSLEFETELILLCNLPYVPNDFPINRAATYEPKLALFGGPDGLDLYRKLFTSIPSLSRQPQYILAESLPEQHEALAGIAKVAGYSLEQTDDFIQLFTRN